jgi:DNA-binding XRE family transcriptional regulator
MTKEQVERWAEAKAEALMRVMRRLRIGFGRSQENVAEGCGLTRQGLSFMERSKRWPLLVNVLRACASLRISLRQLAMVARC